MVRIITNRQRLIRNFCILFFFSLSSLLIRSTVHASQTYTISDGENILQTLIVDDQGFFEGENISKEGLSLLRKGEKVKKIKKSDRCVFIDYESNLYQKEYEKKVTGEHPVKYTIDNMNIYFNLHKMPTGWTCITVARIPSIYRMNAYHGIGNTIEEAIKGAISEASRSIKCQVYTCSKEKISEIIKSKKVFNFNKLLSSVSKECYEDCFESSIQIKSHLLIGKYTIVGEPIKGPAKVEWYDRTSPLRKLGAYSVPAGTYFVWIKLWAGWLVPEWNDNAMLHIPKDHIVKVNSEYEGVIISGTVSSAAGSPIYDAVVSIDIERKSFKAKSTVDGSYRISFPKNLTLPDTLIIRADKEGFNTTTRIVNKAEFSRADIKLSKVSRDVIQIDRGLHHLGNSNYEGVINSRFQKSQAEGASYTKGFEIPEGRLDVIGGVAKLGMTVKGVQSENPILLNGKKVGVLNVSNPDGSATSVKIDIDPCALKPGWNTLVIKSIGTGANGDIDDFEFANIQLIFTPAGELSPGDKGLAEVNSVRVMDTGFKHEIKEVFSGGSFSIEAKGKGRCEGLKDMAVVNVFPKNKGEDSVIRVRLVETGPNTSVFRAESPISVANLGVKAGERLVVRAGVRGTSVIVKETNWQPREIENRETEKKKASVVSETKKEVKEKAVRGKGKKAKAVVSSRSKVSGKKPESPGTIPLMGGSRKLRAGIPVKAGHPSKEDRCASLRKIKERINRGERPRLFKRTYRAPNGETFEMIEASEEPLLKSSRYRESIVTPFIIFSEVKRSLDKLMKDLRCN